MTDIQPVNIPASADTTGWADSEIGMNLIDLGFLQILMRKVLPPEHAESVNQVLMNMAQSMYMLKALAQTSQTALDEAIAQRDAALAGAGEAVTQRDAAVRELHKFMQAVQQIDQTNPDVAQLVRTVWDAAQADIIQQIEAQRGA